VHFWEDRDNSLVFSDVLIGYLLFSEFNDFFFFLYHLFLLHLLSQLVLIMVVCESTMLLSSLVFHFHFIRLLGLFYFLLDFLYMI
jgi:hypothetical protein